MKELGVTLAFGADRLCNACWAEPRMRYQNQSLIARGRGRLAPLWP